jgi:hypothetical protein
MLSFILFAGSALVTSKVAQLRFGSQRAPARAAVMASSTVIETAAETTEELDVIVVGAGAAGVGTALMLTKNFGLDTSRVLLIERGEAVGETFRRWPKEMRFISPSFNMQGWTSSFDLNSVAFGTSPAYSLGEQHPTGAQYADYLNALAGAANLRVRTETDVTSVNDVGEEGEPLFNVVVRTKPGSRFEAEPKKLTARYVVWAAGEFQYPAETQFAGAIPGAELCMHNSRVPSWATLPGDDFVVIGGCVTSAPDSAAARTHPPCTHSPSRPAHPCLLICHTPGTRAALTRPSTWQRPASGPPCWRPPPRGTSATPTRPRSSPRTPPRACAR